MTLISLDIVGHEYAHAINAKGVSLICNDDPLESAALVEGFCDAMGVLVQSSVKPLNWNYAQDVGTLRHLHEPKNHNKPSSYAGQYWCNISTGEDFRYCNSRVLSYWFYLLSQGAAAQLMEAILMRGLQYQLYDLWGTQCACGYAL
ncbi:MAG: M4 family metallopeptidase [Sphingobacteriales bacterium]|nr:M4 family metallopeptidase [Sphingobacteriales bacterium]